MRTTLMACLFAGVPGMSWGAQLLIDSQPTVDLPGFRTYVFSIEPEGGEVFRGVDATFTGPMNQVTPFGMKLVFFEAQLPDFTHSDPSHESSFLFNSGDVLSIGADESDELLTAAIAGLQNLNLDPGPVPFAQIATATPDRLHYDLQFDLGTGEAVMFNGFLGLDPLIGDCDNDGDVDILDFGIFADAFSRNDPTGPCSDFDSDGDVDIIDFGLFADNFGFGAGVVAVPEPTTAACLSMTLLLAPLQRQLRRRRNCRRWVVGPTHRA